jgi:lipopolysaccharide biosynthesis protein
MLKRIINRTKQLGRKKLKANKIPEPNFWVHIDSPSRSAYASRKLIVSGWLITHEDTQVVKMRIKNGGKYYDLPYGKERTDVAAAFPDLDPEQAKHCGFARTIQFVNGKLEIHVDFNHGSKIVHTVNLQHSTEMLPEMLYNPNLATYWAEHENTLANKHQYYYEAAHSQEYVRHDSDPRLVAFYLPQFHPIKENDEVWGTGFTEWSNVTAAVPRFVGHYQPILPADFGFYDLRVDEIMADQIALAKKHGIYGFAFYYYWFSGKRLLERPIDTFLKHREWDFNFVICWANENWTKRWDGRHDDVIVAQQYREEDPKQFIKDVENILLDPRYIRENGKPVLIVYRVSDLKDPARYARIWREYFRQEHKQELHLVLVMGFDTTDPRAYGFDAGIEFPPLTVVVKKNTFENKELPPANVKGKLLDPNFEGGIVDYRKVAFNKKLDQPYEFPAYRGVMPSWDNEARKKGKGASFHNVSPDIYGHWLKRLLVQELGQKSAPLLFINAWNEWAEGTVLEPTRHYGHAVLNRTTEVLAEVSQLKENAQYFPKYHLSRSPDTKLAVVVHAFYQEEWAYIQEGLKNLNKIDYDLFVTINEKDKSLLESIKKAHPNSHVIVVPNRGRDILPFIFLAGRLRDVGYEYILKLHTKKSYHRTDGNVWFEELVDNLLPPPSIIGQILEELQRGTAMIGPAEHYVALAQYIGSNETSLLELVSEMHSKRAAAKLKSTSYQGVGYFAGSMFWARLSTLGPLLDVCLLPEDFDAEWGQIDGTLAHAVERIFGILPQLEASKILLISSKSGLRAVEPTDIKANYKFAP